VTKIGSKEAQIRELRERRALGKHVDLLLQDGCPTEAIRLPGEKAAPRPTVVAVAPVPKLEDKMAAAVAATAERKRLKAKGRIAKLKAQQSGETKKMPATGKAALAIINQEATVKAKKQTTKKAAKEHARQPVRSGSKVEIIASLLKRPEGCTTADVLKATGWPSVSMPAQAKAAGVKLKKQKDLEMKVTRYFAA